MLLTEKAKEKFYEYVYYSEDTNQVGQTLSKTEEELIQEEAERWFNYQDERFQISLIIEWLDEQNVWEKVFYEVYIESTEDTKFSYILKKSISASNEVYNFNQQFK